MNKSLITLAVLGAFAGVASAQSSVTIYGSVDLGITKSNGGTAGNSGGAAGNTPGTAGNPFAGGGTGKAWTLQQANTSRVGLRGNEDLGGGLSAQFQIEHRFNPDTGTQQSAAVFWNGRSYVQLTSATAGGVYLGRDYTPAFWPALKSDPFGWDGVGQMGLDMWAGFRTPNATATGATATAPATGGLSVRSSNTVGYKSPNISGLTAQVAVALGEGNVGRDTAFNVEYAGGPIYGAVAYEKVNNSGSGSGNAVNGISGDSLFSVALHYNFGVIKPIFYASRSKTQGGVNTNKFYMIAATAPLGGGTVKAAYYRLDPAGNNSDGSGNNQSKLGLGYDYALSKRTNLYGDLGLTRSDFKAPGLPKLTNNSTYSFGLKHTF